VPTSSVCTSTGMTSSWGSQKFKQLRNRTIELLRDPNLAEDKLQTREMDLMVCEWCAEVAEQFGLQVG
jgi:alpha-tubulin suppressor-like RCC1 family protein